MRSLGATALAVEAVVLLLAIQPIRVVGGKSSGAALWATVALAVLALALAASLRHRWAWYAATVTQGLLLASGFLHWSLGALGIVFGLLWLYVLHVRRSILN